MRKYKNHEDIREYFKGCIDENTKIDKNMGMVWGICAFRPESLNNRIYKPKAVNAIKSLMDGCKCFMDHGDCFSGQSLENLTGILHKPRKHNGGIYADLEILDNAKCRNMFFEMAENHPSSTGFSISARGVFAEEKDDQGREQVEDITNLWSTDWVDSPATTSGMFEKKETNINKNSGGDTRMDKILMYLEGKIKVKGLTEDGQEQAVIKYIEDLEESDYTINESLKSVKEDNESLKAENAKITKEFGDTKDKLIAATGKLQIHEDENTKKETLKSRKELIAKVLVEEKLEIKEISEKMNKIFHSFSEAEAEDQIRELVKLQKTKLNPDMDNGDEHINESNSGDKKKLTDEEARLKLQEALEY